MSVDGTATLDMKQYGMDGFVSIREPRFSRRKEAQNAIGRMAKVNGKEIDMSHMDIGDIETIGTLMYVEQAPFPIGLTDLKPFYDYCDKLDDWERGLADRFWNDLTEAVRSVQEGETDPLDASAQDSQTANSV